MADADPFNLARFVTAQEGAFATAIEELDAGEKRGHWIWFVFPQLVGLGFSQASIVFGLKSLPEAQAYLDHPILGPRLRRAAQAVVSVEGKTLRQIMGSPDDLKFRSSMTLFAEADASNPLFHHAVQKYCPEGPDRRTLELLGRSE